MADLVSHSEGEPFQGRFAGRPVLVTGHTGFKGAWLAAWLDGLGARVTGLALAPDEDQPLFHLLGLARRTHHREGDVRDAGAVTRLVQEVRPDFVFHLAAQALVRRSYQEPADTFATNVQGTVNVLEAVRLAGRPASVVVVTSDKCYAEADEAGPSAAGRPSGSGHREDDPLGGRDPYSASKAAAEMVTAAYRSAFFPPSRLAEHGVALASARAGNVIGGGDAAPDRIVPDILRALAAGEPVRVRNPGSVRPWQHVLDALSGYLWLAARLDAREEAAARGWNFGPVEEPEITVADLARRFLERWGRGEWLAAGDPAGPREAPVLRLDCSRAVAELGWRPVWSAGEAIDRTVAWHRSLRDGADMAGVTGAQIAGHLRRAGELGRPWAPAGREP